MEQDKKQYKWECKPDHNNKLVETLMLNILAEVS